MTTRRRGVPDGWTLIVVALLMLGAALLMLWLNDTFGWLA